MVDTSASWWPVLERHLDMVIERNKVVNLTRITNRDEARYLHIYDSLLLADALAAAPEGPFVDIGTGAGYPGIPLAVSSGRQAVLIDSVGKKVAAVGDFVSELGLSDRVRAVHVRAEDLARTEAGRYAAVVARAVAQTNVLLEYAAPLLKRRGRAIIAKAHPSKEELEAAARAARICGLENVSRETFELPDNLGHREVLVYEKVASPQVKLPRATGMAAHKPLGIA